MKKYAKVINEETKLCEVGLGTNSEFYQSIGMTEQEVEQAYNGNWYLKGYAPSQPLEELKAQKRAERDNLLQSTDKFMLSDYPITEEEKGLWIKYRKYLRDLPEGSDFPNVEVLTFEDWNK